MELIIDEGRISGSRYHRAKPEGNTLGDWHQMLDWCEDTYGPTPEDGVWTPNARWYMNNSKFWFRELKDLEWFVLKWQ